MVFAMPSILAESRAVDALLEIEDLGVTFPMPDGDVTAVREFSLRVGPGECVGLVGESGAGKSQAMLAIMGLLPATARVSGSARLEGLELLGAPRRTLNQVRGCRMTMIFQDPMTSLTPHMRIGAQIGESLVRHRNLSRGEARSRARGLLERVHMSDAARRLDEYPHELSGGMRQRAMLALALACEPKVLIADEPTTALDVTIQAQILALLAELKRELGMALVLITHDFGVVAGIADRVAVMYGGRIVEQGSVGAVLKSSMHPYTRALLRSMPRLDEPSAAEFAVIRGQPPDPRTLPAGCAFHPRCDFAADACRRARPSLQPGPRTLVACHFPVA
jgi:oligopeptide transport system ATP-binding protein